MIVSARPPPLSILATLFVLCALSTTVLAQDGADGESGDPGTDGGIGTATAFNGLGGNGGDGGDARTRAFSFIAYSKQIAMGGNGGSAFGLGAIAGNGGNTSVHATFANDPARMSGALNIQQYGGHGGSGFGGANGGNGAEMFLTGATHNYAQKNAAG